MQSEYTLEQLKAMTHDELKEIAIARTLPIGGNSGQLAKRIFEAQTAPATPPAADNAAADGEKKEETTTLPPADPIVTAPVVAPVIDPVVIATAEPETTEVVEETPKQRYKLTPKNGAMCVLANRGVPPEGVIVDEDDVLRKFDYYLNEEPFVEPTAE